MQQFRRHAKMSKYQYLMVASFGSLHVLATRSSTPAPFVLRIVDFPTERQETTHTPS